MFKYGVMISLRFHLVIPVSSANILIASFQITAENRPHCLQILFRFWKWRGVLIVVHVQHLLILFQRPCPIGILVQITTQHIYKLSSPFLSNFHTKISELCHFAFMFNLTNSLGVLLILFRRRYGSHIAQMGMGKRKNSNFWTLRNLEPILSIRLCNPGCFWKQQKHPALGQPLSILFLNGR